MGQPTRELLSGHVKLTVWLNDEDKRAWRSVTMERMYKDRQGAWRKSQHFRESDLLDIAAVAEKAHGLLKLRVTSPIKSQSKSTES